jgi:2'-5' RNA ligase
MMKENYKCIYLGLEHPLIPKIAELRSEFDPAYGYIIPHITLMFPFHSPVSESRLQELFNSVVAKFGPIEIELGKPMFVDSFAFLPVAIGRDRLTEIHDWLYSGEMNGLLSHEYPYIPHVTIGRYHDESERLEIENACNNLDLRGVGVTRDLYLETIICVSGKARIDAEARM